MARATNFRPYIFDFDCFITGHHIYKDIWTPILQEELNCEREPSNQHDKYAVKVIKEGKTVGHIPQVFSKYCSLILLAGGSMKVGVTGKRENKRGKGLEVPCRVTIKAPISICMKVEPIIKDLCTRLV